VLHALAPRGDHLFASCAYRDDVLTHAYAQFSLRHSFHCTIAWRAAAHRMLRALINRTYAHTHRRCNASAALPRCAIAYLALRTRCLAQLAHGPRIASGVSIVCRLRQCSAVKTRRVSISICAGATAAQRAARVSQRFRALNARKRYRGCITARTSKRMARHVAAAILSGNNIWYRIVAWHLSRHVRQRAQQQPAGWCVKSVPLRAAALRCGILHALPGYLLAQTLPGCLPLFLARASARQHGSIWTALTYSSHRK
jgi:hypothetical protein